MATRIDMLGAVHLRSKLGQLGDKPPVPVEIATAVFLSFVRGVASASSYLSSECVGLSLPKNNENISRAMKNSVDHMGGNDIYSDNRMAGIKSSLAVDAYGVSRNADDSSVDENPKPPNPVIFFSGLQTLAHDFVKFMSQTEKFNVFDKFEPLESVPLRSAVNLVEVASCCKDILQRREGEHFLRNMFLCFMEYYKLDKQRVPDEMSSGAKEPFSNPEKTEISQISLSDLSQFRKLLSETINSVCSNAKSCVEDLMDFEYLWEASINKTDVLLIFNDVDQVHHADEASLHNVKRALDLPHNITTSLIVESAKEMAWVISRAALLSQYVCNRSLNCTSDRNFNRRDHIVSSAACIDLIMAAMFIELHPSRIDKPRSKRLRVGLDEGEAAQALSMISAGGLKFQAGVSAQQQNSSQSEFGESLARLVNELLSAVTAKPNPVSTDEIKNAAECIATFTLPWFYSDGFSRSKGNDVFSKYAQEMETRFISLHSPASKIFPFISSHQLRQANLGELKEIYRNTISYKIRESLLDIKSQTEGTLEQSALQLGWDICKFQQFAFVDEVNTFYRSKVWERKLLVPFDSQPQSKPEIVESSNDTHLYAVRAIVYRRSQHSSTQPSRIKDNFQKKQPAELDRASRSSKRKERSIYMRGLKIGPKTNTETIELNEWTGRLLSLVSPSSTVKPSRKLCFYLESSSKVASISGKNFLSNHKVGDWKNFVLPALNYLLSIVAEECGSYTGTSDCLTPYAVSQTGEHVVPCNASRLIDRMPSIVLLLYYFALESILCSEATQRKNVTNPTLVLSEQFHSSLFSLSYFCLRKATGCGEAKRKACSVVQDIGDCPVTYFKVIESFIQALKPCSDMNRMGGGMHTLALPTFIIRTLNQVQERLLELLWMSSCSDTEETIESSFIHLIKKWKEDEHCSRSTNPLIEHGAAGDPIITSRENRLVKYIFQNLLALIESRILALCKQLKIANVGAIKSKAMLMFECILHHKVDLLFDRHPDQLMICIVYFVCVKMKLAKNMTFMKIKSSYCEMNREKLESRILRNIIYHVCISSESLKYGNIIFFYNEVFVPNMQSFWNTFVRLNQSHSSLLKKTQDTNVTPSFELEPTQSSMITSKKTGQNGKPRASHFVKIPDSNVHIVFPNALETNRSIYSETNLTCPGIASVYPRAFHKFGASDSSSLTLINKVQSAIDETKIITT